MLTRRLITLLGFTLLCIAPLLGCGNKDGGMVDAPLMKNAPPPPERPNKPTLSPSGGGGKG